MFDSGIFGSDGGRGRLLRPRIFRRIFTQFELVGRERYNVGKDRTFCEIDGCIGLAVISVQYGATVDCFSFSSLFRYRVGWAGFR